MRKWLFLLLLPVWAQAADYSIASSISVFDCDTDCGGGACAAGDNLILDAGNRGPITFRDCEQGTAGNHIVIKNNSSGQTVIQHDGVWPLQLRNVQNLTVDGTQAYTGKGVGEGCGAQYVNIENFRSDPDSAVSSQQCGIKVECSASNDMNAAIKFRGSDPVPKNITIKGVEVDGGYPTCETGPPGIGISNTDNSVHWQGNETFYEGHIFEDNYIHHTASECLYLGANVTGSTSDSVGADRDLPMRNIIARNNVILRCGYDGIDFKLNLDASQGRSKIYGNMIAITAEAPGGGSVGNNGGGIFLFEAGFTDVYNNWVQDTSPEGEGTGSCYTQFIQKLVTNDAITEFAVDDLTVSWWNNIAVGCKGTGINSGVRGITNQSMPSPTMFNNTVVGTGGIGINIDGDVTNAGTIQDNIVCDSGSSDISGGGGADTISSNQTAACSSQDFVNLVGRDFHLASTGAPAYDDGVYASPPSDDYDGVSRPQGAAADDGAFEFETATPDPDPQRGGFQRPSIVK